MSTTVADLAAVDQRWVPGDGPVPARLAYVGEGPGKREVQLHRPLVGPTGEINWQLAPRYGRVDRSGAYVTNWHKTPITDEDKKRLEKDGCDGLGITTAEWDAYLEDELRAVRPETVAALGAYAVRALLGPEHSLLWCNGIPIRRAAGDFVVVPIVHPAAGMHDSTMLQRTADGYAGLRRYLAGEIEAREQGVWRPGPMSRIWRPEIGIGGGLPLGVDTEGSVESPYMVQIAWREDDAWVVMCDDAAARQAFVQQLHALKPRLIFHHAIHDAGVMRAIGVEVWDFDVVDTMVLAFNLQDLPKDLKNLTRGQIGVQMRDYTEVVEPWRERADETWRLNAYERALAGVWMEQQFTPKGKPRMSKGQPVYRRRGLEPQLSLVQHVERSQQIQKQEQDWAEHQPGVGRRPDLNLRLVPLEEAVDYAGRDAAVTLGVANRLLPRIAAEGLEGVMQLDHQKLPLVEDMQRVGMHVDIERYWEVLGHVSTNRERVAGEIRRVVAEQYREFGEEKAEEISRDFNPGSSDQVEEFCHAVWRVTSRGGHQKGILKLEKPTKSKMRFSTDSSVLALLKHEHPFIPLVLEYRELDKYEGTYLLPMMSLIREVTPGDFRLFANLRVTTVVSGRLSAHDPNTLAWPARTQLGMMLRSIFTAPPGWRLASWDLSQIELRIAAALAKDPVMIDAFLRELDLHSNLASKIFGYTYEDCETRYRQTARTPAKNIHYMMLYGGGGGKLYEMCREAGVTQFDQADCHRILRETWRIYRKTGEYLRSKSEQARRLGYVTDWLGRRRFLPGCRLVGDEWPLIGLRLEAERQAGNFDIQGAASELLGMSMHTVWSEVYPECRERGYGFRLWLQIHDELMGQVRESDWEAVNRLMVDAMTRNGWLTAPIPVVTEGKMGGNWSELK